MKDDYIEISLKKRNGDLNAKTYRITSMQDIYDCITPENRDKFHEEFGAVLDGMILIKSTCEVVKEKDSVEFPYFDWTDD